MYDKQTLKIYCVSHSPILPKIKIGGNIVNYDVLEITVSEVQAKIDNALNAGDEILLNKNGDCIEVSLDSTGEVIFSAC